MFRVVRAETTPSTGQRNVLRVFARAQRADQVARAPEAMFPEICTDAIVDLAAHERIVEQRGSNSNGGGAGNHEFDCILRARDSSLPDDRYAQRPRDIVDL